ncbi:MAG: MFS transporter [Candidatus Aenigmatarchaeota archaeon]
MVNYYRNIPLLYVYSALIKRVSMPIIIIYFLLNNLNYTQIGILLAVTAVVVLSTELHGGVFADLHGKKKSLLLHSVFGALTMFLYFIGDSFAYFLLAALAYGIAGAFVTGTRNALLYDTLVKLKRTSEFKKFNGRVVLYSHVINALVLLTIPVIYVIDTKLPFLIGIFFFVGSFISASLFVEPTKLKKQKDTLSLYNKKLLESFKEIGSNKKLLFALLVNTIVASFIFMSATFTQPLLLISGLSVIYFGVIYAIMRVVMGLGGETIHRLEKHIGFKGLLFLGFGLILLSFLGQAFGFGLIIIIAVIITRFAEGFNRIVLEDEINKNIKSNNRTTILSISSFTKQPLLAALLFVFGITADLIGVQSMYVYAIITFIVISGLVFMIFRK